TRSRSLKPSSRKVGVCGNLDERAGPVVPITCTCPFWWHGIRKGVVAHSEDTCPPPTSLSAKVVPVYGMCFIGAFRALARAWPRKCITEPVPGEPYTASFGCARHHSPHCASERTGSLELTAK